MSTIITTPSPSQVSNSLSTYAYLSTKDIHAPDVDPFFVQRFGDEAGSLIGLFEELGRYKPVGASEGFHYEKARQFTGFTVASIVAAGAAGASVTITVAAADHNSTGAYSRPQVGELVLFAGGVVGRIMSKSTATASAHTVTVAPLLATENIPALAANDRLALISTAYAEGTDQPGDSLTTEPYKARFRTQIFKRFYGITGSELTVPSYINIKEGSKLASYFAPGHYWHIEEEMNTYKNFMKDLELGLLLSKETTNTNITGAVAGKNFQTTTGLIPLIKSYGINPTAYTTGAFGLTNIQSLTNSLAAQGGSAEYLVLMGLQLAHEWDNFLHALYPNGAVTYATFGTGDTGMNRAISYGYKSFRVADYNFHRKVYKPFQNPELLGGAYYDYKGDAFMIPMDMQKDAKTAEAIPSLQIRYKAQGGEGSHGMLNLPATGYSRKMQHWLSGAAAPGAVKGNNIDQLECHYLAELGLQAFGLNRYVYIERA